MLIIGFGEHRPAPSHCWLHSLWEALLTIYPGMVPYHTFPSCPEQSRILETQAPMGGKVKIGMRQATLKAKDTAAGAVPPSGDRKAWSIRLVDHSLGNPPPVRPGCCPLRGPGRLWAVWIILFNFFICLEIPRIWKQLPCPLRKTALKVRWDNVCKTTL